MINLLKFKKTKIKKNYKSAFLYVALTISSACMVLFPQYASKGIKSGMDCCLNTLIPSMFPFMIISSMMVTASTKQNSSSVFTKITKPLFYLPGQTFSLVLMSLFGGYPIGAYCAKYLYKNRQINKEQLNRIMSFCVNSGPAFIVSVLGESLLKSQKTGLKLFLIQCASSILIGVIGGILARFKKTPFYENAGNIKNNSINFSTILIDSCNNTCRSLVKICALITLFFGVTSLLHELNIIKCISITLQKLNASPHFTYIFTASVLEMTQACIIAAKSSCSPYWVYSWIIGFGGICAHTQIIAELKDCPFNYRRFLLVRFLNGIITAFVTAITIKNQDYPLEAYSNLHKSFQVSTSTPTHFGSIALLILCIMFTLNSNFPFEQRLTKLPKH